MLLVVDVGNTNIVLGVYDGDQLTRRFRIRTVDGRTADETGVLLHDLFAHAGLDGSQIEPSVTWGIHPGHNIGVGERIPTAAHARDEDRAGIEEALEYMDLDPGSPIAGTPVDVAFIGSCTNGRISDLREAARVAKTGHVQEGVRALVVPGSQDVARQAIAEGLDDIFRQAGFDWREPGCSMCLAMNPDKLIGREICASSSNRNFKGRQGSPAGRTLLMSPAMVAAAALAGRIVDVREVL